jgi:hypothetical protein
MQQLELEYFWPLTQQVPLNLDFTDCEKPKLSTFNTGTSINSGAYLFSNGATTAYSITSSKLNIDVDSTIIKVSEKPNIIRRGLYKALGVKWEKK